MLEEDDQKEIIELRQHYRNCFSSPSGKVVLKHMLYEMRLFNDDIDENDQDSRVLRNYASTLIERLGCGDDTDATLEAIVNAILGLPIKIND